MTRRIAILPIVAATLLAGVEQPASAAPPPQALIFLLDGTSFEQLMAIPEVRSLARAGGAGLMSARTVSGDRGPGTYLTLGTGVRSVGPEPTVRVEQPRGASVVLADLPAYLRANSGRSTPGLLGSALEAHGIRSCIHLPTRTDLLVAMDRRGVSRLAPVGCSFHVIDLSRGGSVGYELSLLGTGQDTLVIVVEAQPSSAMNRSKDELTPIVMAEGSPATLFGATGPMHTLTSDTTRRVGVVSNEDVAPTILQFFGIPVPSDMNGSPIRLDDAPAPFALHAKHLENRRATVPVQIGAGITVTVFGLVALLLLVWRRRVPRGLYRLGPILPLMVMPLAVAMLAAGRLPHETYAWSVPFLVAVTAAGGAAAFALSGRGPLVATAALGAAVIGFLVAEALLGWPDTQFTLLGGTALDGARFYGLPNNMIGLVMPAGLWVAAVLSPFAGFALLVALAFFVGFPDLGANLGGALTLLVAAGLWLVLRPGRRLHWRDAALVVGVVVAGMAVVLAAQVVLAGTPTHGTRFVENTGSNGIGHVLGTLGDRLLIGWRLLLRDPFAFVPVLGLPVTLAILLRPPPVLRDAFGHQPEWRTVLIVLVLASIVAYVVNDTGPAAVGLGWGLAVAGMLYLPLWDTSRHRAPEPAARPSVPV